MSSHNERVTPTPFDAATPTDEPQPAAPVQSGRPSWVLPALGGLQLIAILVVFWLPSLVSDTPAEPPPSAADASEQNTTGNSAGAATPDTPDSTPWMDAQAARERKATQDILAELLEIQYELDDRGAQDWAAEQYQGARDQAEEGDSLYQSREYESAGQLYSVALKTMTGILEGIPAIVDQQMSTATAAIEALDQATADESLALAARLEPENAALPGLQQRASQLPDLQALVTAANAAELEQDLTTAKVKLSAASELDSAHQFVAAELARVTAADIEKRFQGAMSRGYGALDQGLYDDAKQSFREAGGLRPGAREPADALLEVQTAQTNRRLEQLRRSAASYEQKERWEEAAETYRKAADIDGNLLFVKDGMGRAEQRAQLDEKFTQAIEEPERLSDVAVAETMTTLLSSARNISPKGDRLNSQIQRLQDLLRQASVPIAVTLQSDMETEVIVYKISRLGRFTSTELSLRPGTYTAVGTRIGYRDVRVTFNLSHGKSASPVRIVCTEQI